MSSSFSHEGQRDLIARLVALIQERTAAEEELQTRFTAQSAAVDKQYRAARERTNADYQAAKRQLHQAYDEARRRPLVEFQSAEAALRGEHQAAIRAANEEHDTAANRARARHKEVRWEIATLYDTTKTQPAQREAVVKKRVADVLAQVQKTKEQAEKIIRLRKLTVDEPDAEAPTGETAAAPATDATGAIPSPPAAPVDAAAIQANLQTLIATAKEHVAHLEADRAAALSTGGALTGAFFVGLIVGVVPAGFALGWNNPIWLAVGLVFAIGATAGLYFTQRPRARRHAEACLAALAKTIAEVQATGNQWLADAAGQRQSEQQAALAKRDTSIGKADQALQVALEKFAGDKQMRVAAADAGLAPRLEEIARRRDEQLAAALEKYPPLLAELDTRYQAEITATVAQNDEQVAKIAADREAFRTAMVDRWLSGMSRFEQGVAEYDRTCDQLYLDWTKPTPADWKPPQTVPAGIRFGQVEVNLAQIRGGIPQDEALRPKQTRFTLPALLPFPERGSLVIKASGEARAQASAALQAVMLRLLTSLPAGKVRFTIVDAMGLGENFSAFMHLADFDEAIVTSRIWTEQSHVEQRLADLTEHMENVIQKYLRNEFKTLEDYNRQAGEVAEPYRFLVVANFPSGFNENALRRLTSIATAGPRCGVFTLLAIDTKQPLPVNFNLAEIEQTATVLRYQDGRFRWNHADFERLPLELDQPASPERFTEIVRAGGQAAKDSKRVEVPFEIVAPAADRWWTESTASQVNIPLGRAGATKLQHLKLGKGTSQHVLVAGKTGSGKSTLLHALVVNAALRCSPDEVEFYLIDFKKGVEFKVYATHNLPHARVIAIESEREFGLSVLERLDTELKRRGELFREVGVQDLPGFRHARPGEVLPRTLLVVDEFQELFVEDDKLAQDAALLLDRLVRQGRAFGIHVLLGSQTLGGAYSLARTTLGQMAVRIALQCSEADAHLILSEENTAARLLSRPGEAIYNDANGLVEGNHPFQVVWLGDDRREQYLRELNDVARERGVIMPPPIVFEGNVAADLATNVLLEKWVAADVWPAPPRVPAAWLGAAVAIKDPTCAMLRRQSGANMLIVGQQPQGAAGLLAASMVSLAAQYAPGLDDPAAPHAAIDVEPVVAEVSATAGANGSNGHAVGDSLRGPRFYVLDGTPPDAADFGAFKRLAAELPHDIRVITPRDVAAAVAEIDQIVATREKDRRDDAPPVFVLIYDLGRLRELRKGDDDFGFSSFGGEPKASSPAKQFVHILREGPALGVHALIWCDTYNNVSRTLDRNAMKDFEIRVLFAMTGVDSSNLIDSPAAGKLGPHRALLYTEEQGRLEKFRPYGWPTEEWLGRLKDQLTSRSDSATQPVVVSQPIA